jgi:hypothetical protein
MGQLQNFKKYKFTPFKLRIGDLEVTNYFLGENNKKISAQNHLDIPKYSFFEIIKYHPNLYYGKEENYELNNWGDAYKSKESFSFNISKSCFKKSETPYMIASWNNINHDELSPDLEFVGSRVFDLSEEEMLIFMRIAKQGQLEIERQLLNNSEDD